MDWLEKLSDDELKQVYTIGIEQAKKAQENKQWALEEFWQRIVDQVMLELMDRRGDVDQMVEYLES